METIKDQIIQKQDELLEITKQPINYFSQGERKRIADLRDDIAALKSRMSDSKDVLKSQELGNIEPDGAEEIKHKINQIICRYFNDRDYKTPKATDDLFNLLHDFARQRLRSELISFLNSIDTDSFLNMSSEERLVDEYLSGYAT